MSKPIDLKRETLKRWLFTTGLPFFLLLLPAYWIRVWFINNVPTQQLYDFSTYYEIAVNVAQGKGYTFLGQPIAFQGMGYSYLLGIFFKLVGSTTELTAKYLNVTFSIMLIPLSYYIMAKLNPKKWLRWAVAVTVAFLPHHIAYCNAIGTEMLSALFVALIIALHVSSLKDRVKWPLIGLLVGASTLTKPFYLAYPIAFFMYYWMKEKDWKRAVASFMVIFVFMWALVLPWTVRNYKHFNRFIPVSYNSGLVLYLNNNATNVHGGFMPLDKIFKTPELAEVINRHLQDGQKSLKLASDLEIDLKKAASKWIKENPAEFMKLGVIRVHSTLFNGSWDLDAWTMNQIGQAYKAKEQKALEQGEMTPDERTLAEAGFTREMNFVRAVADISLVFLSGLSIMYVFVNLAPFFIALFGRKKVLADVVTVPLLNIGFVCAVYFVYEGQPRYNFPLLFLFVITAFLVIDQMAIHGMRMLTDREK